MSSQTTSILVALLISWISDRLEIRRKQQERRKREGRKQKKAPFPGPKKMKEKKK